MPVIRTKSGLMSVRTTKPGDVVVSSSSPRARRSGGGSRPDEKMSTRETPTPGAHELTGSAQQRERQIQIFQSQGRAAFEAEVARINAERLERQRESQRESQRQEVIQREIERQEGTKRYFASGTRAGGEPVTPYDEVFFQPTITQEEVDTFRTSSGKKIPITKTFFIDPKGEDIGGGAFKSTKREATQEEINYLKDQTNYLQASTEPQKLTLIKLKEGVLGKTNVVNENLKDIFTAGGRVNFGKYADMKPYDIQGLDVTTKYLESKGVPKWIASTGGSLAKTGVGIAEFSRGFTFETLRDIQEKPLKNVAIFGASYGIGFGFRAAVTGASHIPKFGSGVARGTQIAGLGVGAGLTTAYVGQTIKSISYAKNPADVGGIVGLSSKDLFLTGYGLGKGMKGFDISRGLWGTRGRTELFIPQGEYPAAPSQTHLSLFKKNVIPKLSDSPGAFHTTSDIFWKGGKITPAVGSSELAGLYGSTKISTPFSRIAGSSSKTFKFSLRDIFTPSGKPGVAFLVPKGFRYSPAGKVSPYKIDGQTFRYAFKKPAKKGFADVPAIKGEIETIFRPKAGDYVITGQNYFTKIKGVRVPLDVAKYDNVMTNVVKDIGKVKVNLKDYNLPKDYSITPTSFASYSKVSKGYGSSGVKSSILPSLSASSSLPKSKSSTSYAMSSKALKSSLGSSSLKKSYLPSSSLKYSSSKLYGRGGSSYGGSSYSSVTTKKTPAYFPKGGLPKPPKPRGGYQVSMRRFGKYKPIGTGLTLKQAMSLGKQSTSKTLGATYKISGTTGKIWGGALKTPKGYYSRLEKGSQIFIEKRKHRLSTGSEKREIKSHKRRRKK